MVVNAWDKVTSKCIINCFRKAGFSQIESDEEELQEAEFIDTNFENWISIDQDLPTFGALSDKELTDLQTKNQEEINNDDDDDNDNFIGFNLISGKYGSKISRLSSTIKNR